MNAAGVGGRRRPVVGVMGSGQVRHDAMAGAVGDWIARQGFHLLTGGGAGVMAAASEAFAAVGDRRGLVIGVLPLADGERRHNAPTAYPNPWVELAVRTHLPLTGARGAASLSRNHINVLTADVLVALPGGPGTASEVQLAERYRRPCIAFVSDRSQIPDVPDAIPCAATLDEVAVFVLERLSRAAGRSPNLDSGAR